MREDWEAEDMVAAWTLVDDDWELVANKSGATRRGFALLLKLFEQKGRFPDALDEGSSDRRHLRRRPDRYRTGRARGPGLGGQSIN